MFTKLRRFVRTSREKPFTKTEEEEIRKFFKNAWKLLAAKAEFDEQCEDFIARYPRLGLYVSDHFNRNSPDGSSFAASIAPFAGFYNGKFLPQRAKGDRSLRLKCFNAEACPICLYQGVLLP